MESKKDLEARLAFLGLTANDQRYLEQLKPVLEQTSDSFVGAFYRHLLSFEPTRTLLRDPDLKERLITEQRDYLLSLANPRFDEDYVEQRRRIGEAHRRVGLGASWYLGAYALYFSMLTSLVFGEARGDTVLAERTLSALIKVLMLDAQIALEAYIERRERQLEYLNRELAETGRKLAREYQEQVAELRETTDRAKAAEQLASIATLVAGLAHEIGTPMGVIRGHAELLESAVSDERSRWRAETIREQIDRISQIIQTLLNIARPRQPMRCEIELDRLVKETLSFLAEKFRRRGIQTELDCQPLPPMYGDPDRLQQLCLNLFLNAADAMPEGGTLGVTLKPTGEDSVELSVTDTGDGIPPDEIPKIFDPFYTTKPAGAGSGLGLVVAQGIISDHDGEIEVRSEVGQGSTFCITLPLGSPQSTYSGT